VAAWIVVEVVVVLSPDHLVSLLHQLGHLYDDRLESAARPSEVGSPVLGVCPRSPFTLINEWNSESLSAEE
jgi:hypothetical protein